MPLRLLFPCVTERWWITNDLPLPSGYLHGWPSCLSGCRRQGTGRRDCAAYRGAEGEARDAVLAKALEYQAATSEVLGVICRSTNELQPVLDSIARSARRLCHAERAAIRLLDGGQFHLVVIDGTALSAGFETANPKYGLRRTVALWPVHVRHLRCSIEPQMTVFVPILTASSTSMPRTYTGQSWRPWALCQNIHSSWVARLKAWCMASCVREEALVAASSTTLITASTACSNSTPA